MKRLLSGWVLFFLFSCHLSRAPRDWLSNVESVSPGDVFDAQGRPVPSETLRQTLMASDVILVGESHGNACDHRFQARLLSSLRAMGANVVVGLEQLTLKEENTLEAFYALDVSLDELPARLKWKDVWGFPFDAYASIFETARATHTRLSPLSLPRSVVKAFRTGALLEADKALIPEKVFPPPEAQRLKLKKVFEEHPHGGNFETFLAVQSLWDTHMAQRVVKLRYNHQAQVLVFTGAGHVENGHGIASRLERLAPHFRRLSFLPWRGQGLIDPKAADLHFFCPE